MKTAKATKGQPEFDEEIRVPRFIWRVTRAWHPVKNDEEGLKILWAGQQKLLEAFDLQFPDQRQPARGLYTAPHDPADSGGLRRTPADFAGLRRTPADSGRFCRTPADSGGVQYVTKCHKWSPAESSGLHRILVDSGRLQ